MKIAVITLATNKYKTFLHPLWTSIQKYFIPHVQKDFYFFTDGKLNWFDDSIKWYKINHEPWPYITLKRFEFISECLKELSQYDYIFYIDSDMEFVDTLSNFDVGQKKYFAVCHPSVVLNQKFWPVETNVNSTAYIPEKHNCVYVQGCVWGAKGSHIEYMVNLMKNNISTDLQNNIIAVWHDESHLNKFIVDHRTDTAILSPSMSYPEHWDLPVNKLMVHKDKNMVEYPRFKGASLT
jgi:hypothetical protein